MLELQITHPVPQLPTGLLPQHHRPVDRRVQCLPGAMFQLRQCSHAVHFLQGWLFADKWVCLRALPAQLHVLQRPGLVLVLPAGLHEAGELGIKYVYLHCLPDRLSDVRDRIRYK